jgi:hypothetical protein
MGRPAVKDRGQRKPTKAAVRERLKARLRRNVEIHKPTGCWLWLGRLNRGYATLTMRLEGRKHPVPVYAHRVSLEVFKPWRKPRRDEEAAHAIDCPFAHCICPDHLRWATHADNVADQRHPRRLRLREIYPPTNFLELAE